MQNARRRRNAKQRRNYWSSKTKKTGSDSTRKSANAVNQKVHPVVPLIQWKSCNLLANPMTNTLLLIRERCQNMSQLLQLLQLSHPAADQNVQLAHQVLGRWRADGSDFLLGSELVCLECAAKYAVATETRKSRYETISLTSGTFLLYYPTAKGSTT